jgi:hypothetical protein
MNKHTSLTTIINPGASSSVVASDVQAMDRKRIEEAQKEGKFDSVDINRALNDVYDIQERALIQFILLGDAAKACKENKQPVTDMIELALPKSVLTYEVRSLFKTWNFTQTSYGYTYNFTPELKWTTKIPVRIYVYANKFKLFDNPNRVWGTTEGFNIPNPFPAYWEMRHLIKSKLEKGEALSTQKL